MSTYSVVVALHIIAVVAAYGLPLTAPLLVPYVRRHHPAALPGCTRPSTGSTTSLTGPGRSWLLAFGIYLASDGDHWDEPFVGIGLGAIAIIAVVGGGVVVPALKRLAALDPVSSEYAAVYRRYMTAESFLGSSSCWRSSQWRPSRSHEL